MSLYNEGISDRMALSRPPWIGADPAPKKQGSAMVPLLLGGGLLALIAASLMRKPSTASRYAHDNSFGRYGHRRDPFGR